MGLSSLLVLTSLVLGTALIRTFFHATGKPTSRYWYSIRALMATQCDQLLF